MRTSVLRRILTIFLAVFMGLGTVTAYAADRAPKQIVTEFFNTVFVEKRVKEGFEQHVVQNYIQHNPRVADGRDAVIKFLGDRFAQNPTVSYRVLRIIAEGDLVAVHFHTTATPQDRGTVIVDIYRVKNGKIDEHWDVVQAVPETAANNNTMF